MGRIVAFHGCALSHGHGRLVRQVYQKPTHTNRYILSESHHPTSLKAGVIRGLADRAIKVSSDGATHDSELRRISAVMSTNGYPRKFVEKVISEQLKRGTLGGIAVNGQDDESQK